ncbi:Uncharacterized conserved protein YdeI, YjbR/CyaY-like superfamily, DUF1801 family [Mucilaginibacter sp. OK268]|uniref:YdeI/OmpD-associated family protein n=1 Tax=Mucilaginibacter sp. OK268 TaxID=1881048 RepID=UPI0008811C97|nr:YdeI/OmpD-associated family protein [Mucilaginibacter sp. OK268]SDQ01779.1 Uncharacterized conserved protein YdeI, YjbR/CyaY-like superfamily, DUF1801 family [Mucilaginibacter sp. OK268]
MAKEVNTISPESRQQWRKWLHENHDSGETIWVICSKKSAGGKGINHDEAVEEALCYGWIDSLARSFDEESYMQSFSKRKPKSVWSKINKEKVERFIKEGLMAKAGFDSIEAAKNNGYWSILDEVEELIIPPDLEKEFDKKPVAKVYFLGLSRSDKKRILQWLVLAKRPETRKLRLHQVVESAAQNKKPKQLS